MQFSTSYIIAASQLFAVAFGAPLIQSTAPEARGLVERAAYKVFGGDGSAGQGWPKQSEWKDFESLWKANEPTMKKSCAQFQQKDNTQEEINNIKAAIKEVAASTKIPDAFILSIVMQESKGCVRAPTTNYGFDNPGLMQSFNGKASCFNVSPCPKDKIVSMIKEGAGVGLEAGLTQSIKAAGGSDAQTYYRASRVYNSGSAPVGVNLGTGIATHCYSSDVANRLIGWDDSSAHGCEEATIGSKGGSSTTTTTTPSTPSTPSTSTASGPKAVGASASCKKWYTVKAGDNCSSTGVTVGDLVKLNTSLKSDCTNLLSGTSYCIAA